MKPQPPSIDATLTSSERAAIFKLKPDPDPLPAVTRMQVKIGPGYVSEHHPFRDDVPVQIVRVPTQTREV